MDGQMKEKSGRSFPKETITNFRSLIYIHPQVVKLPLTHDHNNTKYHITDEYIKMKNTHSNTHKRITKWVNKPPS